MAGTPDPANWKRAVRLQPGDAELWGRIGLWDLRNSQAAKAVYALRHAVDLDPYSSSLWVSLADAYEASGQPEQACKAYEKAQADFPVSPDVSWRFGSFLLRQGDWQDAARQVHRALESKPELAASAISQFWKAGVGLDRIFGQVLPAKSQDYLPALDYFVSQKNFDLALSSWERLASLGQKIPLDASLDLTDNLIALHRVDDANRVWRQALTLAGRGSEAGSGASPIFNGGFENSLVNGGFGWRWIPTNGASLDLVGDVTHGGAQSARVTFDGTANVDFGALRQYVAVRPGQSYRFSAYMRTDAISTDSGPQFVIWSCADPVQQFAQTAPMTGTHPWTGVQTEFTAGTSVPCVDVVLRRVPSPWFDSKIEGTVWVDDVRLLPIPAGGKSPR